jgi:hypothetical protein
MCVSRLENCNISGVECGKIEFLNSIAFSVDFLVYSKKVFNVKVTIIHWSGRGTLRNQDLRKFFAKIQLSTNHLCQHS